MKTFFNVLFCIVLAVIFLTALAYKFEIVAVVLAVVMIKVIQWWQEFWIWANTTAGIVVIGIIYLSWKIDNLKGVKS
ncbi:hypothetical protein [Serratia marcescens]|uniref:Uncharacterized protein n=1 Tax=Serratia marcescens TaxID=615 RepID=A0AAP8PFN5_SERMA|nr:hypothetical protein [Serratia marcescens]PNO65038.1 hypothetical protein MC70_017695 [Serratia marcescens]